jgi:hypothetical protein
LPVIIGIFGLAVLGAMIYWIAIVLATASPGTVTDLVLRATIWATLLGLIMGTVWSSVLYPWIVGRNQRQITT